jgi:nucleotide-binding universal stress UspA family protein
MAYDSILVPTDGSDHADRATAHALSLAETFDATVHALSVVDIARLAGPFDAGGVDASFIDRVREQAKKDIEHVENRWAQPDQYRGEVREGTPSRAILEYIDEHDIDLVAMGTHGRRGLSRFVLGSVTEHVLRASPVPVLATRASDDDPPTLPYRNIMVPTDGSTCADGAVEHALDIASASGATVHAINVVDTELFVTAPGQMAPSGYIDTLEEKGKESVEEIATRGDAANVTVSKATAEGRPSEGILDYATENEIDLVVMGTHGRGGLDRFLLGSTTERVIRQSSFPVLAVPVADEEPET